MVLDPIPQSLPVHFFGSRPQPPTSRWQRQWYSRLLLMRVSESVRLSMHMCVCICVYLCFCVCICVRVRVCVWVYVCVNGVYMHTCMCHWPPYAYMYCQWCLYSHMCVSMASVCMYACVNGVHTHIWMYPWRSYAYMYGVATVSRINTITCLFGRI